VILPSSMVINWQPVMSRRLPPCSAVACCTADDVIRAHGDVDESRPEGPARQRTELCQEVVDDRVRAAMVAGDRAAAGQHPASILVQAGPQSLHVAIPKRLIEPAHDLGG
jgi:hypothetical protein